MSSCVKPVSSRNAWYSFSVWKFSSLVRWNSCATSRSEASMPRSSASPKIQAVSRTSLIASSRSVSYWGSSSGGTSWRPWRFAACSSELSKRSRLIWPSSTMPSTFTPSTTATESSFGSSLPKPEVAATSATMTTKSAPSAPAITVLFPPFLTRPGG